MPALNQLASFLQGASNAAASTVSGPVDLSAWALRKLGVPVPENALGSSQWMAERGLTAKPKNALAGVLGESVGGVVPILAGAYAPQVANALMRVGENMAAPATMNPQAGAVVWHGSPHKFDAFDSSKIGTGEGAQAYGHGLYLAEKPEVAGSYIQAGRNIGFENWDDPIRLADKAFGNASGNKDAAIGLIDEAINNAKAGSRKNNLIFAKQVLQRGEQTAGVYKVDLPDEHIARMLDWDKPLSQQAPVVQQLFPPPLSEGARELSKTIRGLRKQTEMMSDAEALAFHNSTIRPLEARLGASADTSGRDIYGRVMEMMGDRSGTLANIGMPSAPSWDGVKAAGFLKDAGITGVRYLDGGSRAAGTGSSNYVIFPGNENLLQILERNGQPVR
jgi:hypothetical protein